MPKYVKKPVVIEAHKWNGVAKDILDWVDEIKGSGKYVFEHTYLEVVGAENNGSGTLIVHTLEGVMTAKLGDMVICGVEGEFYFCKPDIFDLTYEAVTKVQPALLSDEELEILGALNIQEGKCDCHEKSQIEARKAIRRGAILGEPLYCEKCIPY